jgi:hypothetical protein
MRTTLQRAGRATLTLLLAATAFAGAPAVAAHAAPDQSQVTASSLPDGAVPGYTMLITKPAVDMSKAKVVRLTDGAGTDASVSCQVLAPVPPYYVDMLCYVTSGIVSIIVNCSDGSWLYSTPMYASPYPYYGRAYCGPPAYVVSMNSMTLG